MNKLIISLLFILTGLTMSGQSFDSFMENVSLNHPDIIAARNLLYFDEASSVTDLMPEDPRLSVGYFPGNEPAPGDKLTWGISQSFDFPSRYARIKALKSSNLELAKMEYLFTYIQIMSEARASAIELISIRNQNEKLNHRLQAINDLEKAYSSLLENGETTILEYNKIVIKKVELASAISSLNNSLALLKSGLDFMSGESSEILMDIDFPDFGEPDLESLISDLKSLHPEFLIPGLRSAVASNAIKVSKSESMPNFEIGYSSEIVADERFTGPSLGVTVPIWNNRGKVKRSIANSDYQAKRAESDLRYLESTYASYFRSYKSLISNLNLVSGAIEKSDNIDLLEKALEVGEISLTDYLVEIGTIYELEDLKISLTKELYLLRSKLNELDFSTE